MTTKYMVIRDTREKEGRGWAFPASAFCEGTVSGTLKTGDYSLVGYESRFAVERKGTAAEFAQNLTSREKWDDFKNELTRLEAYPAAFIILEFDMTAIVTYPDNCGLPWAIRQKIRISPGFYLKRLLEIELEFKTKVIAAGPHGRAVFASLCKRVVEKWPN